MKPEFYVVTEIDGPPRIVSLYKVMLNEHGFPVLEVQENLGRTSMVRPRYVIPSFRPRTYVNYSLAIGLNMSFFRATQGSAISKCDDVSSIQDLSSLGDVLGLFVSLREASCFACMRHLTSATPAWTEDAWIESGRVRSMIRGHQRIMLDDRQDCFLPSMPKK